MIKIFRKIRQKLLAENRLGSYLKYAIGEIILVVIGILIALSINNWNENEKSNKVERRFLYSLREDFIENETRLKETIKKQKRVVEFSTSLLQAMQSKNTAISADTISTWVASGAKSWWRTEFVTGSYDSFTSSGKISILKNESLKKSLSQFSSELSAGFEDHNESISYLIEFNTLLESKAINFLNDTQYDILGLNKNVDDREKSVKELILDDRFSGILATKTWLEILRLEYQHNLLQRTQYILNEIDKELEQQKN